MIDAISTTRHTSTTRLDEEGGLRGAKRLADAAQHRWRKGEEPNTGHVLASHPELRQYRSVVLNLAYAEYRSRLDAGESLDAETFARRFPSLEKSLYLLLEVHGLLSQDPELQQLQGTVCWPEAGSRFLQFDLIAEIGRGAFGRVFLATEPAIGGRQVVVKVAIHGGGEAEIIGRLRHPNIVPIYSLQEDKTSKLAAFCMPYMGRATLCDVLDQSFSADHPPLHARTILDAVADVNNDFDSQESVPASVLRRGSYEDGVIYLSAQLADGLAHSHRRGIYHRDLKPSNVLVTPEGRPLLLDFNLSIDSRVAAWKVGGTLPYMAPEELAALARQDTASRTIAYDPRSDIYSLGVIVYELLTGEFPFGAIPKNCPITEAASQLRQQQAVGPKPIRNLNSRTGRGLAHLVESCLAFEPDSRPETAAQLAAAFHRELSVPRRSRRWVGTHKLLVSSMSAFLFSVVLATSLFFLLRPPVSVRQLRLGLEHLDKGQYTEALTCLNKSLLADPNSSEALFARGCAYHRLGEYVDASKNYDWAEKLNPDPLIAACRGYCSGQAKEYSSAIVANRQARMNGYDYPSMMWNNSGYCYYMQGTLDYAERHLLEAIQLDDDFQTAHYNLLLVYLQRVLQGTKPVKDTLAHVERTIQLGPPTAELYHAAATLYMFAAKKDPAMTPKAIQYVRKAVELGLSPAIFQNEYRNDALFNEPSFQDALRQSPTVKTSVKPVHLIDPLDLR